MPEPIDWYLLDQVVFPGLLSGFRMIICRNCGRESEVELGRRTRCSFCGVANDDSE